jgi:DNA excision repair protein ERCC-2
VAGALSDGQSHTDRAGVLHRFAAEREMPEDLFAAASRIADEALSLADPTKMKREAVQALREAAYPLRDAALRATLYGDGYECFYEEEAGVAQVRLVCLDPSREIARRLSLGRAAVLFSATLSPLDYYRSVLGGERSDEVLEVNSPFDPSQLSVCIMDKISTRFSEREDTLLAVCRAIAATVSAKRGNYMVFSPSFAYSEALAKIFSANAGSAASA